MPRRSDDHFNIKQTLPAEKIARGLDDLLSQIELHIKGAPDNMALIGIQTRGYILAQRIQARLKTKGITLPLGALDITLYRDDIRSTAIQPVVGETHLDFDLDNKRVILIDDVLFTGRTIRAALDELMDYGRPLSIHLMVLVDRGHRELPIQADYAALKMETQREEAVNLRLQEVDGVDDIVIGEVK